MIPDRPNVAAILDQLKDFQRASVEEVFHRLYLDPDATNRFLIADEVGLGKTMVAKGVIAKVVNHLWEKKSRIDVVYICSNADIARQNIARLNIGVDNFSLPSRITLLPKTVHDLRANKLNFISFTPGTSFDLKGTMGRREERALLYLLLEKTWRLKGAPPLNVFSGTADRDRFEGLVEWMRPQALDRSITRSFRHDVIARIEHDRAESRTDIRRRFRRLCKIYSRSDARVSEEDRSERSKVIGELRALLASTCLNALEPDIVILDEFQRFRHLLTADSDAGLLEKGLFEFQDQEADSVKVLMLSATPYKMYTTADEKADDDHYSDFVKTLTFLQRDPHRTTEFQSLIDHYRRGLVHLGESEDHTEVVAAKVGMENMLRKVMVRTERLASTEDRQGMLRQVATDTQVEVSDLKAYLQTDRIARVLEEPGTLEYWKSAPYLLNFMDEYEFKRSFRDAIDEGQEALTEAIASGPDALLAWDDIRSYSAIDPRNARLRVLINDVVDSGAWLLAWIPPALPYYELAGPFAAEGNRSFTKRLVFSAWQVVPKVIAALTSYEVERRIQKFLDPEARRESGGQSGQLLRISRSAGRLTGLPLFTLLYPSSVLAREIDPLADRFPPGSDVQSALAWAEGTISKLLDQVQVEEQPQSAVDESWYWAAPVLLDLTHDEVETRQWLSDPDLEYRWGGTGDEDASDDAPGAAVWRAHVAELRELIGTRSFGSKPPDLVQVLALSALGGPGTLALRMFGRVKADSTMKSRRYAAAQVAWAFRSLFNTAEVTAIIRGLNAGEPYWQRVLEYATAGCLQSVMDEYAHQMIESNGLTDAEPEVVLERIPSIFRTALTIRTANLGVDEIRALRNGYVSSRNRTMRAHYGLRFGKERDEEGEAGTRSEAVRDAFNSPFWPFVLATTSVGQEGLDFHNYCHAVVHWNLPSNPVDLEQREGRVHRYKGHAVRKNLAETYGQEVLTSGSVDPWRDMFRRAVEERSPSLTDLVPYWVFAPDETSARIERHVPGYPLSKDGLRLEDLRRSLAIYRMVFGQPRQDDLIDFLMRRVPSDVLESVLEQLKIDLAPRHAGSRDLPAFSVL